MSICSPGPPEMSSSMKKTLLTLREWLSRVGLESRIVKAAVSKQATLSAAGYTRRWRNEYDYRSGDRAINYLDIIVAEQVMGWRIEDDEPKLRRLNSYFPHDDKRRWWRKPEGGWQFDPLLYSSNMTATWQVVEKMNADGYVLFLLRNSEESKVAFDEPGTVSPNYITERSVAGAICKAALIATARQVRAKIGA
jgi:hypothetical protein